MSGVAGAASPSSGARPYDGVVSAPRPAATVVLLRPGPAGLEALLTHRPTTMAFAPDVQVFPGGRVDAADADPRLQARSVVSADDAAVGLGGDLPPVDALAASVAAIREAFEEVGVLLADPARGERWSVPELLAARRRLIGEPGSFPAIAEALDLRLRTDLLVPLSRWVTPPTLERRFDARFFAAAFVDGSEVTLVGDEVVAHAWHRPIDALESMAAGEPRDVAADVDDARTARVRAVDRRDPRASGARSARCRGRRIDRSKTSFGSRCRPAGASPVNRSMPTSLADGNAC